MNKLLKKKIMGIPAPLLLVAAVAVWYFKFRKQPLANVPELPAATR